MGFFYSQKQGLKLIQDRPFKLVKLIELLLINVTIFMFLKQSSTEKV